MFPYIFPIEIAINGAINGKNSPFLKPRRVKTEDPHGAWPMWIAEPLRKLMPSWIRWTQIRTGRSGSGVGGWGLGYSQNSRGYEQKTPTSWIILGRTRLFWFQKRWFPLICPSNNLQTKHDEGKRRRRANCLQMTEAELVLVVSLQSSGFCSAPQIKRWVFSSAQQAWMQPTQMVLPWTRTFGCSQ